jgi:hypothetical protein
MGRWLPWLLTALGGFILLILLLNLREKDYYENGSLTPVAGDPSLDPAFKLLVPESFRHACPTCGECAHPIEVVANRRVLSLRDRDGWYKLIWAGDETYHFEELQHLAACYENRTAESPYGRWNILAKVGPPQHAKGPPHECGAAPQTLQYRYDLVVVERVEDVPERQDLWIQALVYRYDGDKLPSTLRFGWYRQEYVDEDRYPVPCPCGKP